ncbi:FUSC family protein [Bounagaea algeriensis]
MWSEWWNRFLASDPALRRLRTASRVVLAVGAELLVMLPLLTWWGQPPPMALVGAVVAINATLGVHDPDLRQQRITTLLMPLPAGASLTLSTFLSPWPVARIIAFLVIIFLATYVRRFGSRYFPLGLVAFMGYFFTMFLQPQLANVPALLAAAVCGALTAYVMRFHVLSDAPEGVLERGRRTLRAQVHGLLHAVRDVAVQPDVSRRRKTLHNRLVRLNETAVMLENTVQQLRPLDQAGEELVRQRVLDVELAAENLLTPLLQLVDHPSGGTETARAIDSLLVVLRTEPGEVREAAQSVADGIERSGSVQVAMGVRRLGANLADLADATGELGAHRAGTSARTEDADSEQEDEQDTATGLQRLETRLAVQVTTAAGAAILAGQLVSPNRWYWAVITAFVVFISTRSRGDLLVRAWQRTAGTLLGVVAGIFVAIQIGGNQTAQVAVLLSCLFLAFYFAGYSYAAMTFFITTLLGALYDMLGTFNINVLEVRLAETAIGAGAGILSALFILPTRTRDQVRDNIEELLLSLRTFLRGTGTSIDEEGGVSSLRGSVRDIDDRLQQVVTSARPLTTYRFRSRRSDLQRSVTVLSGCAYYVRNLAVSLPPTVDMTDADTRGRLAELLWALADAAEALTTEAQQEFGSAQEAARNAANSLHDLAEALPSGPTSLHRSLHWLDRIEQVLEDLDEELFAPAQRSAASRT